MLPTTSHNDSNSDIDNTADSPGDTQSPLTAVTAGVVSAVVLFLVMLATVAMFLVRRGKLRYVCLSFGQIQCRSYIRPLTLGMNVLFTKSSFG